MSGDYLGDDGDPVYGRMTRQDDMRLDGFWQNSGVSIPSGTSYPPRGWYTDPAHPHLERYWDGVRWTQVVRHAEIIELKNPQSAHAASTDPALDLPLAGWWRRFGSGVADTIIAWVLTFAMMTIASPDFLGHWQTLFNQWYDQVLAAVTTGQVVASPTALINASSEVLLVLGGVTAVYCVVFLGTWGATLGHKLMGVKVVKAPLPPSLIPAQANVTFKEEKPGWLRSISKGLGWALFSSGGILFGILQLFNVLLPLWQKRKQSITDLFASTLLVRNTPTKKDT